MRARVLDLSNRQRHRGPDWSGLYQSGNHFLAHERLAIMDPNSGDQPLFNEDRTIVVTVNGELYNYQALMQHIRDKHPNKKDPFGVTCMYIGWGKDGSLWVSNEMKCLKDDCTRFEQFPPGHYYSSKTNSYTRYFNPQYYLDFEAKPPRYPTGALDLVALRTSFERAVEKRLMSDVPFGVLLSGGLDSSLVAAVASRKMSSHKWGNKLHSFCIGLPGSPDLLAARQVADFLGTEHHEFTFTVQEEFQDETVRKVQALHKYDCMRANKSTMAWGVEARVPFLDKDFVNVSMTVDPKEKMIDKASGRIEKYILRKAFDTPEKPFLPNDVLWRQKEQFSDGVGYNWIDGLKAHAEENISDQQLQNAQHRYPSNTPRTKEAYWYRSIFEEHFSSAAAEQTVPGGPSVACSTATAAAWDAAWLGSEDPSGRAVHGVHDQAYEAKIAAKEAAKETAKTKAANGADAAASPASKRAKQNA
ncbi:hypothetical protein DUNSADRAFT_9538 [Dunaliella salina]|uniref:Asparagine synthetase [glutamine-hydrolyzing] n=1 Tax=Dunaliella salina TaxID=3046 RepID=A0ABQ7GHB4_DUNSA|nr:hypothetical protein DUNSADRAFT_9538 [Dunaliella salina]|eukprot:KAF5833974.1 hypothetical protein DUNSADRAFT_9538 [Dunaliella salina]